MARIVKAKALRGKNTVALARWLLGKYLVRRQGKATRAWRVTETEAYHSVRDRACHASRGRTRRTATLFAAGGVWYVYLCYGVHEMLNLVTGPADFPAAVLIRAGQRALDRGSGRTGAARRHHGRPAGGGGLRRPGLGEEAVAVQADGSSGKP